MSESTNTRLGSKQETQNAHAQQAKAQKEPNSDPSLPKSQEASHGGLQPPTSSSGSPSVSPAVSPSPSPTPSTHSPNENAASAAVSAAIQSSSEAKEQLETPVTVGSEPQKATTSVVVMPSVLQMKGVHNCRDLGGYHTADGKKVCVQLFWFLSFVFFLLFWLFFSPSTFNKFKQH